MSDYGLDFDAAIEMARQNGRYEQALQSICYNLTNRLTEIEGHDEVDIKWVREVLNYELEKIKKVLP